MSRLFVNLAIFALLAVFARDADAVGRRIRIANAQIVEILNDREAIIQDEDGTDVYFKIVDFDFTSMTEGQQLPTRFAVDVIRKWNYITDSGKKTSYVARPVEQEADRREIFVVATERPAAKVRTWHIDEEPKFQGTLANANLTHVKIRAVDGEIRVFERSRLSPTSNEYVDRMLADLATYRSYQRSRSR